MQRPSRPQGKGFYVRDSMAVREGISRADIDLLKRIGVRFAAVNVVHPVTIRRLQDAGIFAWVFALPGQWDEGLTTQSTLDDEWRRTLAQSHRVALATGAHRVWVDPENGWRLAGPETWRAFGAQLAELAQKGIQVAVTTHNGLRSRVAQHIAPQIAPHGGIVSPQLYDHSLGAPLDYAANSLPLWERTMSGCIIVPSVGVLSTGPDGAGAYTDRRYADVFRAYPRKWSAAIVWPERDPTPFQARVLAAWKVGYALEL